MNKLMSGLRMVTSYLHDQLHKLLQKLGLEDKPVDSGSVDRTK